MLGSAVERLKKAKAALVEAEEKYRIAEKAFEEARGARDRERAATDNARRDAKEALERESD